MFSDESHTLTYFDSRYEAYDRTEGQAVIADKTAELKANGNGELSKTDQKEIDSEKQHQLNMRHRGVMQYKAARYVAALSTSFTHFPGSLRSL